MISFARKLIDSARQANRRRLYRRRGKRLKHLQKLDVQSRFEYIFEHNYWNSAESRSGNGSTLQSTQQLRPQLEVLLKELDVKIFFDAPCGDWNWMREVKFPDGMQYIGGDIVAEMIELLKKKYGGSNIEFRHLNIIETAFPAASLWMCRDSLFHLSMHDIVKTLDNFIRSKTPYALLTNMPQTEVNDDIMTGSFRPLNLLAKPFGFPAPRKILHDNVIHDVPRYMGLWHRDDIAPAVERMMRSLR